MQYLPLSPRKLSKIFNIGYMCMYTHKICFYENLNIKLIIYPKNTSQIPGKKKETFFFFPFLFLFYYYLIYSCKRKLLLVKNTNKHPGSTKLSPTAFESSLFILPPNER